MTDLPLGRADYNRAVAKEAQIQTRNRYYEANPILTAEQTALISRPGLRYGIAVGDGPIRGTYSQPGSFNDALFVVSANAWYRVETNGAVSLITAGINPGTAIVSMAGTGTIGDTPEFMYLADGRNLWIYEANAYASGTLAGAPANNDVVVIGTTYYKFTTGSVDAGTPAGTVGAPWLVALGAGGAVAMQSLAYAINDSGAPGVDYSTVVAANPSAQVQSVGPAYITLRANAIGALGNAVVTTDTGAALAWTAGTLTNGGTAQATVVETPDDVAPISVGYCSSYVVVIPAQGAGINGRFWWIQPGETTIDPLDFATAERAPDPVYQVIVFGDQFWLPGSNTTEVWYFTGTPDNPVLRLQGVTFDRGTWAGTALQVKESMIIVDSDGSVFQISGGLKEISNPSIAERIRNAIQKQAALGY